MADGIAKGVGEQLGTLTKQIAVDIATIPAKITGLGTGTNETKGQGSSGKQQAGQQPKTSNNPQDAQKDATVELARKDEIETQKQLAQARRLLELIMKPVGGEELTLQEQLEREELEKRKKEVEEENKKAKALPRATSKRPRGDLYGVKAKQFGGELGKNAKAQ